ncbi:40S ribosomal protein S16 [Intoshia linei]|uniref:Small ribosomal subunit protein uS9 n=1 Tax=Intoshia linei TaxID=1819745 RepID=A0A177B5Y9_9BILA|nr:40S ribosomal protein S16 [Intoshia linei]
MSQKDDISNNGELNVMNKKIIDRGVIQVFGKKKTAVAVAHIKNGSGMIRVNGRPLTLIEPACLRMKTLEPLYILGSAAVSKINMKISVKGGGKVSQIYAIRQAISRGIVAYLHKHADENAKRSVYKLLASYDKSLLISDPRRCEPKKFGGPGPRARYQKSYR